MLSFSRSPVLYGAVQPSHAKVQLDEEKEQSAQMDRQQRARFYERLAVLPAQPGLPRPSSHPVSAAAAVPIPAAASAASSSSAVSRFARSAASSSQSLPSPLRRSQPIDIPAARRSSGSISAAVWHRSKAWQAAADETDGGSSSGDSDAADDWYRDEQRQLSDSFVDDSQLQWSGRCLDDDSTAVKVHVARLGGHEQLAQWTRRAQSSDSDDDEEEEDSEREADSAVPFPLMAPSYHVDFELN